MKALLLTDIDSLKFQDKAEVFIENEQDLRMCNKQIISNYNLFGIIVPIIKHIDKETLMHAIEFAIGNNKIYDVALFWLYVADSIVDLDEGITNYSSIISYRLIWSAFNSLYNIKHNNGKGRDKIERFAKEKVILEYFKELRCR